MALSCIYSLSIFSILEFHQLDGLLPDSGRG